MSGPWSSIFADWKAARRASRRHPRALAILGSLLLIPACSSLPFSHDATPHCPVALVPSQELAEGLRMRMRVHVTTPESSLRVETAVEVRDGKLVVAAFTPFGTRAFAITQTGTEYEIEGNLGRHLGVRPVLILDALHRAYLLPSPGTTPWQWDAEWVEEQRDKGRLERRAFRSLDPESDAAEAGARVEYRVLENVEALDVENDWCPYVAQVVILARSQRPAADGAP